MSQLSDTAKAQLFNQEGGGFLVLLTISHSALQTPIRVVNNNVDVTSNGVSYIAYPFEIVLPDERDGSAPKASLRIDNVSQQIVRVLRQITTPPNIDIQVVRIDNLNAVEIDLPTFKLSNVGWDDRTITGDLVLDDVTREPFPARSFTPAEYPGLFGS